MSGKRIGVLRLGICLIFSSCKVLLIRSSPRTPNFKPLEESFSNLRDEKERKKNTTLKLRLEGMKKTIQELERKLHEKDREVLLWKQKSAQQTRQVRTLSKQPPPKTRTVVENRHEHRKVEEQLQKQVRRIDRLRRDREN